MGYEWEYKLRFTQRQGNIETDTFAKELWQMDDSGEVFDTCTKSKRN